MPAIKFSSGLLILLCLLRPVVACAQPLAPPLERELHLAFDNEPLESALEKIQQQTGVIFSYQPVVFQNVKTVSADLREKTVREALVVICGKKVAFNVKRNYVILKIAETDKTAKSTEISGYVYDGNTDKKIANVSIYDPKTLVSVTSDNYGFYKISVPVATPSLSINKQNYKDTTLVIDSLTGSALANIEISEDAADTNGFGKRTHREQLHALTNTFFKKFKTYVHTLNVRDSLHRDWQVSFLPYIGTNHKMSANVYNRLSFNVLGGYSRGVTGFEAGGLFNFNREKMTGSQIAGLFNATAESVLGFQAAGLFNLSGHSQRGVQAAGLMNINRNNARGTHLAGLFNISRHTEGAAIAGFFNLSDTCEGIAIAGLGNIAELHNGIGVAGLFNISAKGQSSQIAGLFNVNNEPTVQVAGFFNVAGHLKGLQIAAVNFADSASGVPLGLLSFVKSGVHQLELSADEVFYTNLSFRTGVPVFYNFVSAGLQPGSEVLWQAGYGIGSSVRVSSRLLVEFNLSYHHVSRGALLLAPSELLRFNPALEYSVSKKLKMAFGPTFNFYHSDERLGNYQNAYASVGPYSISSTSSSDNYNQKTWIGGKFSLRFF